MDRICGKCAASNPDATWSATEACPKCGAVYAKVDQHLQVTADKARSDAEAREVAAQKAEQKRIAAEAREAKAKVYLARAEQSRINRSLICRSCGTVGETKRAVKGSTGLEVVLWLLAITVIALPIAIIYSVWRSGSRHTVCRVCRGTDLIPVGTRAGQQLFAAMNKRP